MLSEDFSSVKEDHQPSEYIRDALKIEREARELPKSYYDFFVEAWNTLEQRTPLIDNWHIKYLCDAIQDNVMRLYHGLPRKHNLCVNIPPRSLKSYIGSIVLCPWVWTFFPECKFINSSHSASLSISHCRLSRQLIESEWYQDRWGEKFQLKTDQNVKSFFENTQNGGRFATSVTAGVTGQGANIIIADDLADPLRADSETTRLKANEHFENTLFTRRNNSETDFFINIQQRLHEEDVTGLLMNKYQDEYKFIIIPLVYHEDILQPKELQKHYENNLFFPQRFNEGFVEASKKAGSKLFHSQMQQTPVREGGNVIPTEKFQFYRELPKKFDEQIHSWDMAFKGGKKNDYVVGQIWGRAGPNFYLIAQYRGKWDFIQTLEQFKLACDQHQKARKIVIEDKANGPAIISVIKQTVPGVVPNSPTTDKEARAHAVNYLVEAGNVYIPHPDWQPWVSEFINECAVFPDGKHDDQVDAYSQALEMLGGRSSAKRRFELLSKL